MPWLQGRAAAMGFPVAYNSLIGQHQFFFGDSGGNDFRRQCVTYSGTKHGDNLIFGKLGHAGLLATILALRSIIAPFWIVASDGLAAAGAVLSCRHESPQRHPAPPGGLTARLDGRVARRR